MALVLVEVRRLPPGLAVLLVPYLALMARHWIGRLRRRATVEPAMPPGDAAESPPGDEPDECADFPGAEDRSGNDDFPMPASILPTEEPTTPPPQRARARQRPKLPEAELLAANWVQVRSGRFIRVEERSPGHPADESGSDSPPDEPHGATAPGEPGEPPEAGPIPAGADADVSGSEIEVEASHAGEDAPGPTASSAC
jgi:hypothetical protein